MSYKKTKVEETEYKGSYIRKNFTYGSPEFSVTLTERDGRIKSLSYPGALVTDKLVIEAIIDTVLRYWKDKHPSKWEQGKLFEGGQD